MKVSIISLLVIGTLASTFVEAAVQMKLFAAAPSLKGWTMVGEVPMDKEIEVMFSMKKEMASISKFVERVSTPGSDTFREWATKDDVKRLRPTTSADRVVAWLTKELLRGGDESKKEMVIYGDTLRVKMTALEIGRLFNTTVQEVVSTKTGRRWHCAGDLHTPSEVAEDVAAVYGLHGMPLPPKEKKARSAKRNAVLRDSPAIGPSDIRKAYGVTGRGSGSLKMRQAVAEFQDQFMNADDLSAFFSSYVPGAEKGDDQVYAYKGNIQTGTGTEALLDIEYIMGVAPGVKTEFWGWANSDFCTDMKSWTTTLLEDADPPLVHSVSYGFQEDPSVSGCSMAALQDIDNDLQTIASRGLTILVASGDFGAGYDGDYLWAAWPAISPWVTAVGATAFTDSTMTDETASSDFLSGSGFSTLSGRPAWQRAAVEGYFAREVGNLPAPDQYSRNGRGTADVSAIGENFNVLADGSVQSVDGTSASTPTFAAMISLINDQLMGSGKSPLGFLNPWLYNNTDAFRDITVGSDRWDPSGYGFDCTTGWDPATGLGSPKFPTLLRKAIIKP